MKPAEDSSISVKSWLVEILEEDVQVELREIFNSVLSLPSVWLPVVETVERKVKIEDQISNFSFSLKDDDSDDSVAIKVNLQIKSKIKRKNKEILWSE